MAKAEYKFNPFEIAGVRPPKDSSVRDSILENVAEFVRDSILDHAGDAKSPVKNGPWKKSLTPAYKDIKAEESSSKKANLELSGELLDAVDFRIDGNNIIEGVFDGNVGKAEGNNIGSYGRRSGNKSKARRFIPLRGETWNQTITRGIKDLVQFELLEEEEDE